MIIGSGTCASHPSRGTPANYISLDDKQFMVDGEAGSLHALAKAGIDYTLLDGIFYTHFHPDHIGGLMPLLQALLWDPTLQRTKDFTVYGPQGLQAHADGLRDLFQEHSIPKNFNLIVHELNNQDMVKFDGGSSVQAFYVPHTKNSLGYRFTSSAGNVIAFSGDTGYGQEVVNLIQKAVLAILECSWSDEQYEQKLFKRHLSPILAGKLAQQGCVKKLVLTHIYPDTDKLPLKEICAESFDGEIVVAQDFDRFCVQGTVKIEVSVCANQPPENIN